MPWGDALAIITMQPPAGSAVYREIYPDDHDQSGITRRLDELAERVELLTVVEVQTQLRLGVWVDKPPPMPRKFSDLFERPAEKPKDLFTFDQIDALIAARRPEGD